MCRSAVQFTRTGEVLGESTIYRALAIAEAQKAGPHWNAVNSQMKKSIRLSEKRGEQPFLAINHFRYAEILHKMGDPNAAREHLEQATALFDKMEMSWWGEQAEDLQGRIAEGQLFRGFAPYLDGPPKAA